MADLLEDEIIWSGLRCADVLFEHPNVQSYAVMSPRGFSLMSVLPRGDAAVSVGGGGFRRYLAVFSKLHLFPHADELQPSRPYEGVISVLYPGVADDDSEGHRRRSLPSPTIVGAWCRTLWKRLVS
jgi:hypothetical protein